MLFWNQLKKVDDYASDRMEIMNSMNLNEGWLHNLPGEQDEVDTFLGYFNVTEEDAMKWDNNKHIRMCLSIFKEGQPEKREMIRFVNRNPLFDADGNLNSPDFEAQFSVSREDISNPLAFCARPHNWEGINKEIVLLVTELQNRGPTRKYVSFLSPC